ncbi:MAG: hypothetical protein IKE29_04155, partial [Paenibacillus sp.]|uniref:hypothetical protein n=1 Tax=Paenibacillus sp. TaxID=58172 RepID=UPI0025ECE1CD
RPFLSLSLNISILSEWSWWLNLKALHPHSGWFFVSRVSRTQLAKAIKKATPVGEWLRLKRGSV